MVDGESDVDAGDLDVAHDAVAGDVEQVVVSFDLIVVHDGVFELGQLAVVLLRVFEEACVVFVRQVCHD